MSKKKFLVGALGVILAGVGLFTIGVIIDGGPIGQRGAKDASSDTVAVLPFKSVDIKVGKADIIFEEGNEWSVSYSLDRGEKLARLDVVNDELKIEIDKKKRIINFGFNSDYRFIITMPSTEDFDKFEISTASGDISLSDITLKKGEFNNVSGDINLEDMTIGTLEADIISGDIFFTGTVDKLEMAAISGDIEIEASKLNDSATFDTISGDINFSSTGEIELDARSVSGRINSQNAVQKSGAPKVTASSISGEINISTSEEF